MKQRIRGLVAAAGLLGGCSSGDGQRGATDAAPGRDATTASGDAGSAEGAALADAGAEGASPGDGAALLFDANDGSVSAATCRDAAVDLACFVPQGCTTSLTGHVYDPAGVNPIYDAVVFVPNDPAGAVPAITPGTGSGASACGTCSVPIGRYVSAGLTDGSGAFHLTGVPATTNVPLVVQVGKWRREVFLPTVTACMENQVPAASSRLPRNQMEGSLPQIAVLTSIVDNFGCLLRDIGVDSKEYSGPGGGGRVEVFKGAAVGGLGTISAPGLSAGTAGDCSGDGGCSLWNTKADLERYDLVLLSCEGTEDLQTKPPQAIQTMPIGWARAAKSSPRTFITPGSRRVPPTSAASRPG
jgi:hypothetical protein